MSMRGGPPMRGRGAPQSGYPPPSSPPSLGGRGGRGGPPRGSGVVIRGGVSQPWGTRDIAAQYGAADDDEADDADDLLEGYEPMPPSRGGYSGRGGDRGEGRGGGERGGRGCRGRDSGRGRGEGPRTPRGDSRGRGGAVTPGSPRSPPERSGPTRGRDGKMYVGIRSGASTRGWGKPKAVS